MLHLFHQKLSYICLTNTCKTILQKKLFEACHILREKADEVQTENSNIINGYLIQFVSMKTRKLVKLESSENINDLINAYGGLKKSL